MTVVACALARDCSRAEGMVIFSDGVAVRELEEGGEGDEYVLSARLDFLLLRCLFLLLLLSRRLLVSRTLFLPFMRAVLFSLVVGS